MIKIFLDPGRVTDGRLKPVLREIPGNKIGRLSLSIRRPTLMFRPLRLLAIFVTTAGAIAITSAMSGPAASQQSINQSPTFNSLASETAWEQTSSQGEKFLAAGQIAEAEKSFFAASQLARKFGESDPRLATSLDNMGLVYQKQRKFIEAEALFRRALAIDEKVFGRGHANVSRDLLNLAVLDTETGKFGQAESFFKLAIAIDQEVGDPDHPFVAIDLENYAALLRKTNRAAEADKLDGRVKEIRAKLEAVAKAQTCDRYITVGQDLFRAGRFVEAEKSFLAANAEAQKLGPRDGRLATTLNNLMAVYERQGRYAEAEQLCTSALNLDEKAFGTTHPTISRDLNNLALLYDRENKNAESERIHKIALDLDQKIFGPDHPNVAVELQNYAALLRKLNRYAEAKQLERQANQIMFKQRILAGRAAGQR